MKKTPYLAALSVGVCLFSMQLPAQQLRTAYFMDKAPIRSSLNPALRPERGYVNIPAIGNIQFEFMSNSLALDNILYPNPNGSGLVTFLDSRIDANKLLNDLKDRNNLSIDLHSGIFGIGFYTGKSFWTVDVATHINTGVTLPKGLFEFAKRGSGYEGKAYDLKDMQIDLTSYAEVAIGYSKPVSDRLTVGGKVKVLAGLANTRMKFDKMHLQMSQDRWEVDAEGSLEMSINKLEIQNQIDEEDGSTYIDMDNIDVTPQGPGGYGGAVDLGITYKLSDNLTLSGALIDLGFISWSARNSVIGKAADHYTFTGFEVGDEEEINTGDFDKLARFRPVDARGMTTRLNTTLYIAGEYTILNDKIGFGLLSSTQFRTTSTFTELTLSANFRPINWFSASLSYSFIHNKFDTFGAALNFSPSWINFFVGTDYMFTKITPQWVPVSQRSANLFFGLSVPLKKGEQ